jgi:hypothetical protein
MRGRGANLQGFRSAAAAALSIAALFLSFAAAGATDASPEAGTLSSPARQTGGGFEFRRRLPSIENPYCAVVTYVLPDFPQEASSTQDENDRAVIVIDAGALKADRAYAQFLMAHECCHHSLGHTKLTTQQTGQLGPQPFYYLKPLLKTMELDADGCAVRLLEAKGERDAVESARERMLAFGNAPTGACYPTGVERADNIARVAAED